MPSPGDPYTAPVSKVDYELVRAFVVGAVPHPVVVSGKVLSRIPGDSVSADRPAQAGAMEQEHGTGNLLMFEGRARLGSPFIQFARGRQHAMPGREPRLALAIGAYARASRSGGSRGQRHPLGSVSQASTYETPRRRKGDQGR
jgi:hypothetical protein